MISSELIQKKMDSMDGGEGLTHSEECIFLTAVDFVEEWYLEQIKPIMQKIETLRVKLGEIKGGVHHG